MTIKLYLALLDTPDRYQWMLGVGIGMSFTSPKGIESGHPSFETQTYNGINLSLMTGRVKNIGWYAKYQFSTSSHFTIHGPSAGGMVRLGSPVYLYLGGGVAKRVFTSLNNIHTQHSHMGATIDMGILFKVLDNIGIGFNGNLVLPTSYSNISTSVALNAAYFL